MNPSFSIIIPTYSRPVELKRTIDLLLPQLDDLSIEIVILDNASPVPVTEVLGDLKDDRIRVIRNSANIGGNANILNCFLTCRTEWLWLLGDDDHPAADAIRIIHKAIAQADEETVYINFSVPGWCEHRSNRLIADYDEFLHVCQDRSIAGNSLFISAGIHRRSSTINYLKFGYQYISTCAPHLIMIMLQVKNGKSLVFSHESIISASDCPPDSYSKFMVLISIFGILDVDALRAPGLYGTVNAISRSFEGSSGEMAQLLTRAQSYDFKYWFYYFAKLTYFESWNKKFKYFRFALICMACQFVPHTKEYLKRRLITANRDETAIDPASRM